MEYNKIDEVQRLLDLGLDVNARGRDGWTLLMVAAWKDKPDVVDALLQRGANRSLRNDKGETAADLAGSQVLRERLGGARKTKPKAPAGGGAKDAATEQHCKQMYGKTYLLCDRSDYSCKTKANTDNQRCLKQGTWY
ncbi:MAG: ankyrin repeat domain-containing protein [Panacagrimonas sp.]